jgi:HEAT repeat protein
VTAGGDDGEARPDVLALAERILISCAGSAADVAALVDGLGHVCKLAQRRAVDALVQLHALGCAVRPRLVAALESPAARQRWAAAFALSRLAPPTPEVLPAVVEALGSDDGDVRWAAAEIVTQLKGCAQLPDVLRGLLWTGAPEQRKMAAYCLREIRAASAETDRALLARLHDHDAAVRLAALSSLARLATNRAGVAVHLVALLEDTDARIRRASAAALGDLGEHSDAVRTALRAAAASPDASLRRAAERSLLRLAR